jgi:hypothetical protein
MISRCTNPAPRRTIGRIAARLRLLRVTVSLAGAALALGAAPPPTTHLSVSSPNELSVGIRSGVDLAVKNRQVRATEQADPSHKKPVYALLWVKEASAAEKLLRPVDARAIGEKLMQVLDAQGFRRLMPGQRPDIVIGAKYCRGFLPNPYTYRLGEPKPGEIDPAALSENRGVVIDNLTDRDKLVARPPAFEPLTGLEERSQRSSLEKLIITVVAWKYPPPRNTTKEPEPLWRATMAVDDPDHRDLNVVAARMLEAGAPFFDRELTEPEIVISQPLPEGHVTLGDAKVIDEPKPARK